MFPIGYLNPTIIGVDLNEVSGRLQFLKLDNRLGFAFLA
jgi:hypothetical protein